MSRVPDAGMQWLTAFSQASGLRGARQRQRHIWYRVLLAILLTAGLLVLLHAALPAAARGWRAVMAFWAERLALGEVVMATTHLGPLQIPRLSIQALALEPAPRLVAWHAGLATLVFMTSFVPVRGGAWVPLQLARGLSVVHLFAVLIAWVTGKPLYDTAVLSAALFDFTLALLLLTPLLLAPGFYMLEASLLRRFAGSAAILGYFVFALPFKIVCHAWLLKLGSPLVGPVLYLACGPILDILAFAALYGWILSWPKAAAPETQPSARR